MISLESLIKALPPKGHELTIRRGLPEGRAQIVSQSEPPDPYIKPEITFSDLNEGQWPGRIVLVAAPAAVGKSSLARFLHQQSSSELWLLEHVIVGTGSISGLTTQLYEPPNALLDAMGEGQTCLILDSLDEAYVKSNGFQSLVEFAADLGFLDAQIHDRNRPHVVVLGRMETVGMLHLILDDLGLAHVVLEVGYFNIDDAKAFVDLKLAKLDPTRLLHQRLDMKGRYEAARDSIFGGFQDLLSKAGEVEDQHIRSFLGYAPVLEAFSALLKVEAPDGYSQVADSFSSAGRELWANLIGVCEMILRREESKFRRQIAHFKWASRAGEAEWFSPAHQIEMLLDSNAAERRVSPLDWMGGDVADIRSSTLAMLNEHPFLRSGAVNESNGFKRFANPIFEEFAHASLSTMGQRRRDLRPIPLRRPTPIFSRLALALSTIRNQPVSWLMFKELLESLASQRSSGAHSSVTLQEVGPDRIDVHISNEIGPSGHLERPTDAISLPLYLADIDVYTPTLDVVIGDFEAMSPVTIAGTVSVYARKLFISTERVDLSGEESSLMLTVGSLIDNSHPLVTQSGGSRSVKILADDPNDLPFNWRSSYAGKRPVGDGKFAEAIGHMRNLCNHFTRTSSRGATTSNASWAPSLDDHIRRGGIDRDFFEYCCSVQLVERRGTEYLLNLKEFGISWPAARHGAVTSEPALAEFLLAFVENG